MPENAVRVEHKGDGVWVAVLDQDAMEDIAHYLPIGARHSTHARPKFALAAKFQAALDAAFPDGSQEPTSERHGRPGGWATHYDD